MVPGASFCGRPIRRSPGGRRGVNGLLRAELSSSLRAEAPAWRWGRRGLCCQGALWGCNGEGFLAVQGQCRLGLGPFYHHQWPPGPKQVAPVQAIPCPDSRQLGEPGEGPACFFFFALARTPFWALRLIRGQQRASQPARAEHLFSPLYLPLLFS